MHSFWEGSVFITMIVHSIWCNLFWGSMTDSAKKQHSFLCIHLFVISHIIKIYWIITMHFLLIISSCLYTSQLVSSTWSWFANVMPSKSVLHGMLFSTAALNFQNRLPWRGFKKMSGIWTLWSSSWFECYQMQLCS